MFLKEINTCDIFFRISFAALTIFLLFVSCKDELTVQEINSKIFQAGKCNPQGLGKTAIADCFDYTFQDELKLKFCVSGNCCPDSNRFASNYKIVDDIITITVKDTARNLCKCICTYNIQAEFKNLQLNQYTIVCLQEQSSSLKELYNKKVFR